MKFVIFHGAYGSKNGNWFPWLKKELIKLKQKVILDQYPVDNYLEIEKKGKDYKGNTVQNLESWLGFFEKNILPQINHNESLVFVGHSLAPVFILHIVEKYNLKLDCAIFVSPFMEELKGNAWQFDIVNRTFYKIDFDWKKIKKLIPVSYVLFGENDPYVKSKYPKQFAKKTQSALIPVKNGSHLGGDFKKLPIVLELCKTRIGF